MKNLVLAGLAAVMIAPLGVRAETAVKTDKKEEEQNCPQKVSTISTVAKKLAVMAVAGTLSFYIGDVAIGCFKKTNPLTHEMFDAFPSKVFFPVLGALMVYAWDTCSGKEVSDACDMPQTQMQGMPKKNADAEANPMPVCMGNCC